MNKSTGFTLVELVIVIVIVGIIATLALPKFSNLTTSARIGVLQNTAITLNSLISIIKSTAIANGLSTAGSNPAGEGGSAQVGFAVTTNLGTFEVDWRNLCPESIAEVGDEPNAIDFLILSEDLDTDITNQSTYIGFELPPGNCYVEYDSFACSVTIVDSGC